MIRGKKPFWQTVFLLSRPLLWPYLAGSYLIAFTATSHYIRDFLRIDFFYTLFFFLIPANIILYGIRDVYDKHSREGDSETKVDESNKKIYYYAIGISLLLTFPLWIYLSVFAKLLFALFLLLCIFSSAKPIQLKDKPYVDILSNVVFAFPGFIAVYQLTNTGVSPFTLAAVLCWTTAMHLFSTIPLLELRSHIKAKRTAELLGRQKSLLLSMVLWLFTAIVSVLISPFFIFLFIYPLIPLYALMNKKFHAKDITLQLHFLNFAVGILLYLVIVFT